MCIPDTQRWFTKYSLAREVMLSHQTEDTQAVAGPLVHADHCASSASGVQGGYRPGLSSLLRDPAPEAPGHGRCSLPRTQVRTTYSLGLQARQRDAGKCRVCRATEKEVAFNGSP